MKPVLLLTLAGLVALQVVAFSQAGAMLEFEPSGFRTARPEKLSALERVRVLATGVHVPRPQNLIDPRSIGRDFETLHIPSGSGETLEAWSVDAGSGSRTVILFHGYAASKASLLPVAASLLDRGLDTILVDFYGSGGSTGSATTLGVREALDVDAVFQAARERQPEHEIMLYGTSMGAAAVLRSVASGQTQPDGVILESVFSSLIDTTSRRFALMGLPPRPLADVLLFWGGLRAGIDPYDHRPERDARGVRVPALVLHGGLDARATPDQARRVFGSLAGPKRFYLEPTAGHTSLLSANRRAWERELSWLLDAVQESP